MGDVDNIGILYNTISKDFDIGSYDDFKTKMSVPENRKTFYDQVGKDYNLGNYNEFEQRLVKKKDVSESTSKSTPVQGQGSLSNFDPEGSGYDYETAEKYGIKPDETGHWPSRVPETGQILKGTKHDTFSKTIEGEEQSGYKIKKGNDGRYYSMPKSAYDESNVSQKLEEIRNIKENPEPLPQLSGFRTVASPKDFIKGKENIPLTDIKQDGKILTDTFTIDPIKDFGKYKQQLVEEQNIQEELKTEYSSRIINARSQLDDMMVNYLGEENPSVFTSGKSILETIKDKRIRSKKINSIFRAYESLDDIQSRIEAGGTGVKSAIKDRMNNLDEILTLGWANVADSYNIKQISDKYQKGEPVTDEETMALAMYGMKEEVNRNIETPIGYDIAGGVIDMIPYMAQFAMTGGVGAGTEAVVNKALGSTVEKTLTNFAKKGVAYSAGAAARVPLFSMGYERYLEGQTGQVTENKGKLEVMPKETQKESILRALGTTYSEIFTEGLLGKIGKATNGIPTNTIERVKDAAAWSSIPGEFTEEMLNAGISGKIEGQDLKDVYTPRNIITTLATVSIVGGGIHAAEYLSGNKETYNKNKAIINETSPNIDSKVKRKIDDIVDVKNTSEEIAKDIEPIIDSGIKDSQWDKDQLQDVNTYVSAKIAEKQADEIITESEKVTEEPKVSRQEKFYNDQLSNRTQEEIDALPTYKEKKFTLATIKPNGDISNVYLGGGEGKSHSQYMTKEDIKAYENRELTIGVIKRDGSGFREAPQKGIAFGEPIMKSAFSKIKQPEPKVAETVTENITVNEPINPSKESSESIPTLFTEANVINDGYKNIKDKIGEKKAQKYFNQVDKLINPNENQIIEYRGNGVVTKEGDKYIFNALSDMDMKNWRVSFKNDITDQFTQQTPQENVGQTEAPIGEVINEEVRDNGERGSQENYLGGQTDEGVPSQERQISEEVKSKAKQKISDGIEGLMSKWGGKQNLLPEERTSLVEDLSNIATGIADLTTQEIKDFIREKIKPLISKLNLTDKEVEEILNESVQPETTGIRMKSTKVTRKEFGLEEYEGTKTPTNEQLTINAEDAIKKGYNVEKLITRMEERELPTALEQRILRQYLSGIEKQFENNPNDENLGKIKRAIEASDVAGTLLSESFRSRRGEQLRDDSLAGFFVEEMETIGLDKLTEQQKETIKKEWDEISDLKKKYEDKINELESKEARKKAEKEFNKQRKQTSKNKKKTKEEFATERKNIIESLKSNWKKASNDGTLSALPLPYAKQLAYITPDVARLMKSYIEEGIQNLDEMIKRLHDDIKEVIPDIQEKDIHNIIAGEYNKPERTKNEISALIMDLRLQAKLINKLEKLESGKEPKTEKEKISRNKEITDLRKQIKEHPNTKLENAKSRMRSELDKLEEDLKTGNFVKEKPKPVQLDKEGIDLKDKLIRARQERQARILQHKYANRSEYEKKKDILIKILNTPRTLMASGDLSAVLRQGLIPTIAHPRMAMSAFKEMIMQMKSQKAFDRWLYDVYNSPDYSIMKESGLYISDPSNLNLNAKEEQFMGSYAEDVPGVGAIIKGSERAYIAYLNKMRVDMFRNMITGYESQGKTLHNSKKLYKETAKLINNETGRGHFGKFEESAKILNTAFFSPRLIASRFTLLTNPVNPKFWIDTPKEVRRQYLIDMAKFVSAGMTMLLLARLAGADVEDDPRSTDFGKIKTGNQRYDIWGGFQSYARLFGQLISGETKSTSSGAINKLGNKYGEQNRLDLISRFARGKLAPVPASTVNFIAGEDIMGDPTSIKKEILKSIFPLISQDIAGAIKEKGVVKGTLSTFPFATLGIGVQNYPPTGSYPQETTNINGKKVNALGETKDQINNEVWAILNKNGFNIQPKNRKEIEVNGKELTESQYLKYIEARGNILKRELLKYREPDFNSIKSSIINELGYTDEEAEKSAENIISNEKVKFLTNEKRKADIKAKEIATGIRNNRKKTLEDLVNE